MLEFGLETTAKLAATLDVVKKLPLLSVAFGLVGRNDVPKRKKQARRQVYAAYASLAARPGFVGWIGPCRFRYCDKCRLESAVPICWNVVTIWLDDVSMKNMLGSLAQFCSSVEVGSPPVSTCTV
jgi:hypothetical protein